MVKQYNDLKQGFVEKHRGYLWVVAIFLLAIGLLGHGAVHIIYFAI